MVLLLPLASVPTLSTDTRSITASGVALIVNVRALDVPTPGEGLKTVTSAVPPTAMSLEGIAAVSCVLLTKVVVWSAPFQRTTERALKLVPFTVRVNPGPPAVALEGKIEKSKGGRLGEKEMGTGGVEPQPASNEIKRASTPPCHRITLLLPD